MATERMFGGRWRVERELGKGGQGVVYEVSDTKGHPQGAAFARKLKTVLRDFTATIYQVEAEPSNAAAFIEVIEDIIANQNLPRAALKELLPAEDAINATTARERMVRELDVLKSVQHPALIRILDAHLPENWFVMELFTG